MTENNDDIWHNLFTNPNPDDIETALDHLDWVIDRIDSGEDTVADLQMEGYSTLIAMFDGKLKMNPVELVKMQKVLLERYLKYRDIEHDEFDFTEHLSDFVKFAGTQVVVERCSDSDEEPKP